MEFVTKYNTEWLQDLLKPFKGFYSKFLCGLILVAHHSADETMNELTREPKIQIEELLCLMDSERLITIGYREPIAI